MRKLLLFLAFPLAAHDLYFMPATFRPKPGKRLQLAFHNGDSFPESENVSPIARTRDAQVLSKTGSAPITGLRESGKKVIGGAKLPGGGDLILTGRTIPNLIELQPEKFEEYLKEEGLAHVMKWRADNGQSKTPGKERYSKYVKSLVLAGKPSGYFNHVVGFTIEIVPETNPSLLKPGEMLPVVVLFRGKPAADLQVESAVAPPSGPTKVTIAGRTDKDDRIAVPVESKGKWRLHALLMERCAEPAVADWESFWASLTFEVQ